MRTKARRTDVARAAGVSPTTVTLVMNDCAGVSISNATRERVHRAAKELGYRPHWVAQALRTGRTNIIGVWLGSREGLDNGVINFLDRHMTECDYDMLITNANQDPDWRTHYERCSAWPVDGVVAVEAPNYVDAFCAEGASVPIVGIGGACSSHADAVVFDVGVGATRALRHLVEQGCRDIVYVVRTDAATPTEPRYAAYLATAAKLRILPTVVPVTYRLGSRNRLRAYHAMRRHFKSGLRPDGVFCFSDDIAIGTLAAAVRSGLRVPEDLKIIGHGGIGDNFYSNPQLSSIGYNYHQAATEAWRMLTNRMANPGDPLQRVVIPARLASSQSTARSAPTCVAD
jgi:DNA-binding LacI/PurR family transcriptional regulator